MKTHAYLPALFAVSSILGACSSSTSKDADNPQASATATAAAPLATTEATSAPATTAQPAASSVATSGPSTQAPAEVEKDPDALVMDVKVQAASGTTITPEEAERVKSTWIALAAASKKIAMNGTKGATGKRRIDATLTLDAPVDGKDKVSIKAKIDSVTLDGHCPFFNMKKGAEITRSSKNATDAQKAEFDKKAKVEDAKAVRDAVVQLIFADLEAQEDKLKPNKQCLPDKK